MDGPRVCHQLSDFTFTFHFHELEKEMATHSSVLAWRIPGMGEPGGLPSMGSHRVGHDWSNLAAAAAAEIVILTKVTQRKTNIWYWLYVESKKKGGYKWTYLQNTDVENKHDYCGDKGVVDWGTGIDICTPTIYKIDN